MPSSFFAVLRPKCSATLQDIWDGLNQSPVGILDGFVSNITHI